MSVLQKCWIAVASKEHVTIGKRDGFAQVCHGKAKPLHRLNKGDILIYYSPRISMSKTDSCQCFTAYGHVKDDHIYQVEMAEYFHPYRRDVEYLPTKDVPIKPLIDKLSFIRNKKRWGYQFRFGLIQIGFDDAKLIANAMTNFVGDK